MTVMLYPNSAKPMASSSTMTPKPPTVDHLPSSGVAKTISPSLLHCEIA
jgi:hypothetical protein